jgi:hypothetical protein
MSAHRETFMSYEGLLEEMADLCRQAAEALRAHAHEADSRDRLIIDAVVDAELKLARDLLAYVHDAPEAVRKTHLQFHADFAPTTGTDSFEAALSALEALNGSMEGVVKAEAAKHGSTDVGEAMASLAQELVGAGKRIAWIQRSAGDL